MVLNTLTVGAAVTPTVIKTYGSHYLGSRKERRQKPTAHISYDEGLHLIRSFLHHASLHTVEEIQAFTSQWVPSPRWVRTEDARIPPDAIEKAAAALCAQLGPDGVRLVGGPTWWRWRRGDKPLHAEWIEMRSEHNRRKRAGEPCKRAMLYVHGGAYFFGSVDEHRYQMQRHARKLRARVFAPRYRLAPQYPFPCGLLDCLAAYLHLLTMQDPSTIVLAGDSAGGGMVVSLMVVLRDQGLPLPAGAILISPWCDLTHSFPSVSGTGEQDYIPAHGFLHRPSMSWPPPNSDDLAAIAAQASQKLQNGASGKGAEAEGEKPAPGEGSSAGIKFSIEVDGELVEIKDQIQMYTTNELISHPLVSPVLQPTLGGLPPMLVQVGGGELLRDEQVYLAHKAANPAKFPAPAAIAKDHPADLVHKYKPTDVQLQIWDDLCHVAPTLSFTRPAKYMYRSIAQFGAWALARAQRTEIDILDDDDVSVISTDSSSGSDQDGTNATPTKDTGPQGEVGQAGDPLPPFRGHMVRQRVDRHGQLYPLDPAQECLELPTDHIGVIKPGPVRKWMASKRVWDGKFSKEKARVQQQRAREMARGHRTFGDNELPPPSALAGRIGAVLPKETATKRSWGMSLWSLWGSSHDEKTLDREDHAKNPTVTTSTPRGGSKSQPSERARERSRRRSHVRDLGQTGASDLGLGADASAVDIAAAADRATLSPGFVPLPTSTQAAARVSATRAAQHASDADKADDEGSGPVLILPGTNVTLDGPEALRPKAGGIAFPFRLGRKPSHDGNASMITLESRNVATPTKELEAPSAAAVGDKGEVLNAVSGDKVERPQPERFETAHEEL